VECPPPLPPSPLPPLPPKEIWVITEQARNQPEKFIIKEDDGDHDDEESYKLK